LKILFKGNIISQTKQIFSRWLPLFAFCEWRHA